jgi:hypothetical protein
VPPEPRPERIPWQSLSPSAKLAIVALASRCAQRFTGTISLELHEGGVRQLTESRRHDPTSLAASLGLDA